MLAQGKEGVPLLSKETRSWWNRGNNPSYQYGTKTRVEDPEKPFFSTGSQ
jgi:hypothetical protein